MTPDRTIAWDTLAFGLARIRHCILCSAKVPIELEETQRCRHCGEPGTPWGTVWECVDQDTQRAAAVAFLLCHVHACREDPRAIEGRVDALLRQRYAFAPQKTVGQSGTSPQRTTG